MTIPAVTGGATITSTWGNAVAAELNGIVSLEASDTTDGSGEMVIAFGVTFAAAPVVVATSRTSLDRFVVIRSISTTSVTVAYYDLSAGALATASAAIVNVIAIGELA